MSSGCFSVSLGCSFCDISEFYCVFWDVFWSPDIVPHISFDLYYIFMHTHICSIQRWIYITHFTLKDGDAGELQCDLCTHKKRKN